MYPVLFEIFDMPVTSFGVMMALGFLVSWWIVGRRLDEQGLNPELSSTLLLYAMIGGVGGAKLYWAVDNTLRGAGPFLELLLRRDGITWYGGLLGGIIAVSLGARLARLPLRKVADSIASAAPFGQTFGRIGCFLVGDDYGRPTELPIGIAFPQGAPPVHVPVHPTQLYEALWLTLVGVLLWRRRKHSPFLFGEYLALSAIGRFAVEILRLNPKVALGMTAAQWIAIGLCMGGALLWLYFRKRPE